MKAEKRRIQALRMKADYLQGDSSRKLAKKYGVSSVTVLIRLRDIGCEIRPKGGALGVKKGPQRKFRLPILEQWLTELARPVPISDAELRLNELKVLREAQRKHPTPLRSTDCDFERAAAIARLKKSGALSDADGGDNALKLTEEGWAVLAKGGWRLTPSERYVSATLMTKAAKRGMKLHAIADEHNVAPETASLWMRQLASGELAADPKSLQMKAEYDRGDSMRAIAKRHSVSMQAVWLRLNRVGTAIRNRQTKNARSA